MISLIANTGIHVFPLHIEFDTQDHYKLLFHEHYDVATGKWILDLAHEVTTDHNSYVYHKKILRDMGYLAEEFPDAESMVSALQEEDINPIMTDEELHVEGEVYKMTFTDKRNTFKAFENKWLPLPYFFRATEKRQRFGALNWCRIKFIPVPSGKGAMAYTALLAFDTRAECRDEESVTNAEYMEFPVFGDKFQEQMRFALCADPFLLMDFCSPGDRWKYINDYLFSLVHPNLGDVDQIHAGSRLNYVATYVHLVSFLAGRKCLPEVTLYKNRGVLGKDVDMVVDIGNSRTTAVLVEDNETFNEVSMLSLTDYTRLVEHDEQGNPRLVRYTEPFDMRLAFRKVSFGDFGIASSRQFVYPSFVRLGREANALIHLSSERDTGLETLTTHSSPKRYLWDSHANRLEWRFLVLDGETYSHVLNLPGISDILRSDGSVGKQSDLTGSSYHFSNRSLMTFALLEMLVQATVQLNSHQYRTDKGSLQMPRRVRRLIITCPTAMSKVERDALVRCGADAVKLLNHFTGADRKIEIVPPVPSLRDTEGRWYYDEATCSQLVYVYGEIGYKYRGMCKEFFDIYGKVCQGDDKPSITIGSLDIGAGTSDLMICKYTYSKDTGTNVTTLQPDPVFYDSFYYAGDDMLNELIRKAMFFSKESALRRAMKDLGEEEYRQKLRDFFGPDHAGQTMAQRKLRRDFNLQYSMPLMSKFLELLSEQAKDCTVRYDGLFADSRPNRRVVDGFEAHFGIRLSSLEWSFRAEEVADIVGKAFEPYLKKIATMMHAHGCDIVLLSGRPASLPPIRDIFLKYYSVSPNRLILLNNYYVGHWYPFGHNTGYITNSKTIVAMGALVGYYATSSGNLKDFVIDKSKLDTNLKSTVNYIEASREGRPVEYCITPQQATGTLSVSSLPMRLNVRRMGLDSYPSRRLYNIDFNEFKIADRMRRAAVSQNGTWLTDSQISVMVHEYVDELRKRMPFAMTIARDPDNREALTIEEITDRDGNDIKDSNIEISLRSLNCDHNYWLDTGAFEIQ